VRVAALSDIHGNLAALEAVVADLEREDVDGIVVVGDTISGPWPVEALELVASLGADVICGNADREVVMRSDRFGQLAPWCAARLGEECLERARQWPLTIELEVEGIGRVLACHSTPASDEPIYTQITPERELLELLGEVESDVVLCGHTHMQYDRLLSTGLRVVNPGSVGMPYEGRRGAYWALLGPDVDFRRTEYDVEGAVAAMRELDAPLSDEQLQLLLEPLDPETATAEFESLRGA